VATYYELLGVSKTCTEHDLKKAFRSLAMKHHPDKNPGNKSAEETFKKINNAYHILIDTNKRQVYDISIAPKQYVPPQTNTNSSRSNSNRSSGNAYQSTGNTELDELIRKHQRNMAQRQAEMDERIRQMHERINRNIADVQRQTEEINKKYEWKAPKKCSKTTSKKAKLKHKSDSFDLGFLAFMFVMGMWSIFFTIDTFANHHYFLTAICITGDTFFFHLMLSYLNGD
jgi:DnaJ-class molecular chaperone